jgi:hypothetical protein
MSTNGMTSWAVDLADVAAIYPFQGWEFVMLLLGLAYWIWWHVAQLRHEADEVRHGVDADASGDAARQSIERY